MDQPRETSPQGLSCAVFGALHIVTILQIIVPLVSDEVHLKVQVPVAQEWLAGQVPQTVVMTGTTPSKIISLPIGSSTSIGSGGGSGAGTGK